MKARLGTSIAMIVAVLLLAILTAACGAATPSITPTTGANATPTSVPKEILPVRYYGPGSAPTEMQAVTDAINKKLLEENVGVEFRPNFLAWDVWSQKINIMISTGEAFELVHIYQGISSYVSQNALVKIDDLVDQYGPVLKEKFTKPMFDALRSNGDLYAVPAYWRDITSYGGPLGEVYMRTDMMEKNNIAVPKTVDELIAAMEKMQKNWGGTQKVYAWEHLLSRTPTWLHRTYDTWPFALQMDNPIVMVYQDGTVKSWLESEEFKKDCGVFRTLYQKGLIDPDVLSQPADYKTNLANQGQILTGLGTVGPEMIPVLKKVDPAIDITAFQLSPEKPNFVVDAVWNENGVPITTKNPEAGIIFLNWLYSSQENTQLLVYGIKDQHYKEAADGTISYLNDTSGMKLYGFPFWQLGYYKYSKFTAEDAPSYIEKYINTDPNALYSVAAGFNFNPDPVKTEYANVMAEMNNTILPLRFGVVDYDSSYPAAIKKLKDAGLDKVVAEYSTQFKAWLDAK